MKTSLFAATALVMFSLSPTANAQSLTAKYDVLVGGLQVGRATITGTVSDSRYKLNLNAAMTGLIGAVAGGKGAASSSGSFSKGRVMSGGYALNASNGSQNRTIRIGIASGTVGQVIVEPPFTTSPERSPITAAQKRGVVDPLGALMMPQLAADPFDPANCNRTIPVFDGAQRFDVKLSFSGTEDVKVKGYTGPVLVCSARYVPLGGHFPNRPQTKFMVENRDLSAWLAPIGGTTILAPVRINVKTALGMTVIAARQFPGAVDAAPTASIGQ